MYCFHWEYYFEQVKASACQMRGILFCCYWVVSLNIGGRSGNILVSERNRLEKCTKKLYSEIFLVFFCISWCFMRIGSGGLDLYIEDFFTLLCSMPNKRSSCTMSWTLRDFQNVRISDDNCSWILVGILILPWRKLTFRFELFFDFTFGCLLVPFLSILLFFIFS